MSVIETEKWQQLKQLKIKTAAEWSEIAGVPVLLGKDRILVSLTNCPHLHIFDCKTDEWQTYQWLYNEFDHVMCSSNDETNLIVYEPYNEMLVILIQ